MADRIHLHDAEVLLYYTRPTGSLLVAGCLRGGVDALMAAGILYVAGGTAYWAAEGSFPDILWFISAFVLCLAGFSWAKYRQWARCSLSVTTERIMLDTPKGFSHVSSRTVKWPQFQESSVSSGGPLAVFWRSKTLCLRYGSSDAEVVLTFPSLRHAKDLKHYLDKADTLIRKNQIAELKPFVEKPRGQRDTPEA